jgi:hypothetical protein
MMQSRWVHLKKWVKRSLFAVASIYLFTVVSQRFSEERELLRLKFRMFVRLGWCK